MTDDQTGVLAGPDVDRTKCDLAHEDQGRKPEGAAGGVAAQPEGGEGEDGDRGQVHEESVGELDVGEPRLPKRQEALAITTGELCRIPAGSARRVGADHDVRLGRAV